MSEERPPAAGDYVADRYRVERLAGRGGMGAVYRALDEQTGDPVALKVVWSESASSARLLQEARVLGELRHPSIVRYVGHGQCPRGLTFLAMEWLEGEDLADRLAGKGLSVDESVAVARRIAEGLAEVHARGIVHRDVKPTNIRLQGGSPGRATLIDFGVACSRTMHAASFAPRITSTGIVLGTVGYMSPEQATGDPDLDPRADVFALGCVLHECLTGEPAFAGDHVMAVLAKVLREQAPRIRDTRPDLPAALDELVARLLAKERALRPENATAVAEALRRVPPVGGGGVPDAAARRATGLSARELRPVSVMLAVVPGGDAAIIASVVQRYGGDLARLANGGLLVTVSGGESTHDQVVRASGCALALRATSPAARIGLSTGWATAVGGPPGSLIDRAASLFAGSLASGIRIDEVTAGLLGSRFEVRRDGEAIALVGQRVDVGGPRTLLGKFTPCVGREREIEFVVATARESASESVARAVLVTGPAGQGKSRLAHEVLARIGREEGAPRVLCARGDPIAPGSSLTLARQLVRSAAGLREGLSESVQRAELAGHVAATCGAAEAQWMTDFLTELLGLPAAEGTRSERFRAANNYAHVMGDGLRLAFGSWLAALCARGPLLIVADDLQWADEPSLLYLADALRSLRAAPLMILGLGRPETRPVASTPWAGADKAAISLPPLGRRAAATLIRTALGPQADDAAIARIVERADGNALYLEELSRHVATEGPSGTLPDTVLALAHSRIDSLDSAERRLVRGASVFGETFWRRGLATLLGVPPGDPDLDDRIERLVRQEIFQRAAASRFADELEYVFRAGLIRDAAYATLTGPDRMKGHLLAGQWLEGAGEIDAMRLAEHFERGGDRVRVLALWTQGAATALKAGNFGTAADLCKRAMALDPHGTDRGKLLHTEGVALAMCGDLRGCAERLREAMSCFESGSPRWFACVALLLLVGTFLGAPDITGPLLGAALDPSARPEPSGPYGVSAYAASVGLAMVGHLDAAESLLARAEQLAPDVSVADPVFVVALALARAALRLGRGEIGAALRELESARLITERTGDSSGQLLVALHESAAFAEAGNEPRCRDAAERLLRIAERLGAKSFGDWGRLSVAQVRLARGQGSEVVSELTELATRLDPMFVAFARAMLSQARFAAGDVAGAASAAEQVCADAPMFPGVRAAALGTLARVALARGDAEGVASAARVGSPRDVSTLLLARAEALAALGRTEDAAAARVEAGERILRIAATIDDEGLRASYLRDVEANALTLGRATPG